MNSHMEKRKFVRAPIQLDVECTEVGGELCRNVLHFSTTNISAGGIFLETDKSFEPGTSLNICIKITRPKIDINAVGTVMWFSKSSNESLNGIGLSLEFLNELDRKQLENFIIHELANRL